MYNTFITTAVHKNLIKDKYMASSALGGTEDLY